MFKPKKIDEAKVEVDRMRSDREEIARLKKQIAEAERELEGEEPIETEENIEPEQEKKVNEAILTKEEVVSAIEFNLTRAYQLLQTLK